MDFLFTHGDKGSNSILYVSLSLVVILGSTNAVLDACVLGSSMNLPSQSPQVITLLLYLLNCGRQDRLMQPDYHFQLFLFPFWGCLLKASFLELMMVWNMELMFSSFYALFRVLLLSLFTLLSFSLIPFLRSAIMQKWMTQIMNPWMNRKHWYKFIQEQMTELLVAI